MPANDEAWNIVVSKDDCSIYTYGHKVINPKQVVNYTFGLGVSSSAYPMDEKLIELGFKPNEIVIQATASLNEYNEKSLWGTSGGDEIEIPIDVLLNDKQMREYENEYGSKFFLTSSGVEKVIHALKTDEELSFDIRLDKSEDLMSLTLNNIDFGLNIELLKTCENYFVQQTN